ncbi:3D domain-containing protein [Lentibacillus sediminis]|uniref:3D domain-containing protein n=1 Tax=Lentibacillus sediminis TaxID=1940529 RepID=UPI000C1C30DC|nr:3D domain-containing protein [Lentibacillus sediminis]
MKKLVAALTGVVIAGTAATGVSAAEYEVEKGDSLWKIANEHNTTVEQLVDINELKSTVIHPKQSLVINEETNEFYVVEQGDTLIGISNEHGVSVSDLKTWNGLTSDLIITGQELALQGGNAAPAEEQAPAEESEPVEEQETAEESEPAEPVAETSEEPEVNTQNTATNSESEQEAEGETISVTATAYTAGCAGCSGITATGINLNENPSAKVIAVDPSVIPLGTEVYVEGYGYAVAGDVGGAINGNKIDIHVPTKDEAYAWGVKTVDVTILD